MTGQSDNNTAGQIEDMKGKGRVKSLAIIGTVRAWNNGGAYVKVPDHLVGMDVVVIPKANIDNITVNVSGITETVQAVSKPRKSQ